MRFLKPKSAANRPIKKSLAHHENQNTVYLYICIEYIYSAVFRLYQLYTFAFCMYIVVTAPLSRIRHSCKPHHTPTYRPFSTSFKRLAAPRSAAIGALLRTTRPSTPNLPTISKNFSKNTCQLEPLVVYLVIEQRAGSSSRNLHRLRYSNHPRTRFGLLYNSALHPGLDTPALTQNSGSTILGNLLDRADSFTTSSEVVQIHIFPPIFDGTARGY